MSVTELEFQAQRVESAPEEAIQGRSQWQLTWRRLRHDKMAIASIIVILIVAVLAILAPVFANILGHGPYQAFTGKGLSADGLPVAPGVNGFPLGTDYVGRDLLIRILYGARISLFVGISTTAMATIAGVAIGLVAGFYGGWIDTVLARFIDAVLAFPIIVLALALAAIYGSSLLIVIAVITFFSWAGISRIVRGQTLSIKEKEYIEAARSLGAGPWRIMFIDILPNVMAQVIVYATLLIPLAIVAEASLSFLGVGVPPPTADWGAMISDASGYYQYGYWWFLVFPCTVLLITTLAFNIFGDSVRDALDPRGAGIYV